VAAGFAAARKAVALSEAGTKARGYAEAVLTLYQGAPALDARARAQRYLARMAALDARFPGDLDLVCFHALALLGAGDGDAADRREAARLLQGVLARAPRHPGALHYLIHADDDRAHAAEALPAARLYAQVAPTVPHALHMPSHIYAELGLWDDAIASNVAAFTANEAWVAREHLPSDRRDWHSLGFLVYAFLQKGDLAAVRGLLALMDQGNSASQREATVLAHATALVNEDAWTDAADFAPAPSGVTPVLVPYVRGLGALWLGRGEALRAALAAERATPVPADPEDRARRTLALQELEGASAALAGDRPAASAALARAEETLASFPGGQPAGPSPYVPPRELEGDVLLRRFHDAPAAAAAYAAALRDAPGRRRSLLGLAAATSRQER
ncbi:MAG TPA: hypothetical protein VMB50_00650, partial [Myxococcales bacterium]|nr:hypothetical protein [Myxococcales bacterium]